MRITGLLAGNDTIPAAIHIYRITMPLAYIAGKCKGIQTGWVPTRQAAFSRNHIQKIVDSDIVVAGRPIATNYEHARMFCEEIKRNGAKLVYETDDDLTNDYRDVSGGTGANCKYFLPYVDAVTVTTPFLKQRMASFTGAPIYVLPNCIDIEMFSSVALSAQREFHGTINVMLVGTPTHGEDWRPAFEAMRKILEAHGNVRLLVGGYKPDYISELERVEHLDFVPYAKYPAMLAQADIVICAIDPDDVFNKSKSPIKALESWAASRMVNGRIGGAAVIATKSNVYNGTVVDGVNGLLVNHTPEGYYDAVSRLLEDRVLMTRLQCRGRHDVAKHSIQSCYTNWLSAYKKIARLT